VAAEVEQAIERMLNVMGIAGAGAQDVINNRQVLLRSLLLKSPYALCDGTDHVVQVIANAHIFSSASGGRRTRAFTGVCDRLVQSGTQQGQRRHLDKMAPVQLS
jgi:hypothetical protein